MRLEYKSWSLTICDCRLASYFRHRELLNVHVTPNDMPDTYIHYIRILVWLHSYLLWLCEAATSSTKFKKQKSSDVRKRNMIAHHQHQYVAVAWARSMRRAWRPKRSWMCEMRCRQRQTDTVCQFDNLFIWFYLILINWFNRTDSIVALVSCYVWFVNAQRTLPVHSALWKRYQMYEMGWPLVIGQSCCM